MNEIENLQYATPDPSWDYFTVWQRLQTAKTQIESLTEYLFHVEKAIQTSDCMVEQRLAQISKELLNSYNFLPPKS